MELEAKHLNRTGMEEGKKLVEITQFEWGWKYVDNAKMWVNTILGVWSFAMDDKHYELKKPVDIYEWDANCQIAEGGRFPKYICREDYINRLLAHNM
jgi:hypothetical protein